VTLRGPAELDRVSARRDVTRHREICRDLPAGVGPEWKEVDGAEQLQLTDLVGRYVARGREYRVAREDGVSRQCQRGPRLGDQVAGDAEEEEREHDARDNGNCTFA
jgi:hypothetical protein